MIDKFVRTQLQLVPIEDDPGALEQTALREALAQYDKQRTELVDRLQDGAKKIQDNRNEGKDVSEWEDHWIRLLHRYEGVCDKIRELTVRVQPKEVRAARPARKDDIFNDN